MKKLILLLLVATTLFAVSCQKEPLVSPVSGRHPLFPPPTSFPVTVIFSQTTSSPFNTSAFVAIRLSPTHDTILDLENTVAPTYTSGILVPSTVPTPKINDTIIFGASSGDVIQFEAYKTLDESMQSNSTPNSIYSVRTRIYVGGTLVTDTVSNNLFMYHTF